MALSCRNFSLIASDAQAARCIASRSLWLGTVFSNPLSIIMANSAS